MDITIEEPSDSRDDEREKSPSPEPFKEPEGMVTIDLNRKSPSPLPQPALDDLKKPKSNDFKHLSLTMLLALLCLFSFAAAIAIHWDDIGWISKRLTHVNENQSLQPVPTPAPLQVPQTTITLDMETCPVDPQEEFRIHLIVCERTRNFEDCCHNHLRSRLPKINDVCSILEMLDLLVEFKKLFLRRTQRDVDIEYKEDDYRKEKEKKEQEKMRTKEKILSYIRHLNKPLQREIPALFDWFGDLFLEYQDEFGNDGKKDDATKEYVPQQAPGIIENEESNYDSPSERVLILEQKQGVEDRRQSNSTQEIDRSISRKKTLDSTDEELFENRTTTSLDFIMNRTSTEKVEINQTSQNLPSTLAEQLEPSDESLNQASQPSKPLLPQDTLSLSNEVYDKEHLRKKRYQVDETYAFPMENRLLQRAETDENNGFEVDNNIDMEFVPNNMRPNEMYPMENFGDQDPNIPRQDYPVIGSPLYPQSIQDDNSQYPGYQSLMNDARSDEELRLPVHTEERDFGRQSWKDMNIYGFNQGFTLPQDSPRINPQEFLMNNGQVTYSYLETPIPQTTTELPHETTQYRANFNAEMRNHESTTHNENSSEVVTAMSDKTTEEATRSSTSTVGTDDFDATDSIESIENIQANNKSVLLEIGKTKIVVSKADDKSEKLNGEMNTTEGDEVTATSDFEKEKDKQPHQMQDGNVDSFRSASQKGFQLVNEDTQSSQNVLVNPNICQYAPHVGSPNRLVMTPDNRAQIISMVPPGNFPKPPFYVMNPSVYSYMPPSPVIPHYGPISQQYNPYAFMNPLAVAQMPPMAVPPVQMSNNNNGQVYLCNPAIQTPNIQPIQPSTANGIEIRSSSNLQDTFDKIPKEIRSSNKTRDSLNCPINEQSCLDGSKCISVRHFCDNEVHCEDGSDETFCSCRERIAEIRLCDGYFDCPDGEDETGCFGCSEDEINCDDWSRFRKGTCVPMNQRCDGIRHCEVTGKDEDDCSILTDQVGETNPMKISNAAGFLHRNYKGKWYPTCFGSEIWALDVCKVEAGPSSVAPLSHQVLTTEKYEGEYISLLPNKDVRFEDTCVQGRAAFVECPPLFCGLRMTIKNPYRPQELDTSIEDMMNHLNRQDYTFGDDSYSARKGEEGHNRTKRDEDFILGGERVVGGKASQPAAWPWVVSIYKNGIFHCGGVIINELWVLTAAHCIDKYWLFYYEIQAGILRRFSYSPMEQFRWVVAAIAHEQYDKSNLKNDIALMRLSSALRYNRYVRPICLPSETTAGADFRRGPAAGTICTTVGWGATIEHGTDPDHMREVDVPILKNCKHPEDIEGQEICAGLFEGGKDACQGDSGGPFMCQNPNNPSQWYLAGIVSHGEGCARPNEPGVYTRVSLYIDWIADNMREENFFSRMPLQKCPGYICKGTNKCIPKKRHCDKVVDCLMGDDEVNCRNTFHNIFKFSGDSFMNSFLRSKNALETEEPTDKTKVSGDILGAVLIESDSENSTVLPKVHDTKPEKGSNDSQIVYSYEKRIYYNNNTNNPDYFRCEELLQMIPIRKRCDKMIDCEDGTDEKDCKCVDYLKLSHPDAICDGIVDCKDSSDESFCFACREEEFNCRKSRTCISKNLVCDGKPECDRGEDEMDCVALTDGKTLVLDNNNRPNMSLAGVVSVNQNGIWRPLCNTSKSDAEAATNSCNYLGFGEYTGFKRIEINNRVISVRNMTSIDQQVDSSSNSTCDGLYVWCSDINHDSGLELSHKEKMISLNETFEAAWNAAIFSDGIYKCMGVILNEKWILTSLNCFHGILHFNTKYLAVLVGKGSRYLDVPGPNDSILKVSKSYRVLESDVVLLRLENVIKFNRYVQPTHLNVRTDKLRKERCVAVGMKNSRPSLVFLETKSNCSEDHTCISAASDENCLDGPWSGVVTCFSGNGWYPAAVFSSFGKSCPFEDDANFTSVRYLAKDIKKYTDNMEPAAQESFCDGFRCDLGNCIDVDMICDGLPQCLGGEDETPYFCEKRRNACSILKNCVCPVDHLTCSNGKCVHKSKFCDRVNDCGDYSDEPPRCTCRSFMKLTHPERVCDGHVNCFDGSDENPRMCQCKSDDFVCNKSKLCISNEMVCNGFVDCPDGEDEKECYSLAFNMSNNPQSGAVLTKSAGLLFESCYSHSPSTSELDNICQNLGFGSCKSHSLRPYANGENATLVPVIDTFDVVWVRREGKVPLLFRTRTGNDAYLTFRKRNNCQQLHIECI